MAIKQIIEDTFSLFSISQFLGMSGWRLWLGRSFKHSGVLHVVACSSLYYTILCQGILPLACSAIISFRGRQAKLWIGRFLRTSRSLLSTRYPHICLLTSACSIRLGWLFPAYNSSWH